MDVLPSGYSFFRNPQYWQQFYSILNDFEWYLEFKDFETVFYKILYERKHLKKFDDKASLLSCDDILGKKDYYFKQADIENVAIINIGTGNSLLPLHLEKIGIKKIISIDFEESVINTMKKYENEILKWECVDVNSEKFKCLAKQLDSFPNKILLDKAFLDSYLTSDYSESDEIIKRKAKLYLKNSISMLSAGDVFIIISLLQPYIIKEVIRNLYDEDILVDIYPILDSAKSSNSKFELIPYVIAIYKVDFPVHANTQCRIFGVSGVPSQHFSIFKLLKIINEIQLNHYTLNTLRNFESGKRISLSVNLNSSNISYSLIVYNKLSKNKNKTQLKSCVILVTPGNEQNSLYSTADGNEKLANSSKCDRLIIVSFNWITPCVTQLKLGELLEMVKADLGSLFLKLATNKDIPIMICHDEMSLKEYVTKIQSTQYNEILVRDLVSSEANTFIRQLIFTSSSHIIQSEVYYTLVNGVEHFLFDKPCNEYHVAICALVRCIPLYNSRVVILGSGVNILTNVLKRALSSNVIYYCVDSDLDIIKMANQFFGTETSNCVKLNDDVFDSNLSDDIINIHGDAIEFVNVAYKRVKSYFDVIILDINNQDQNSNAIKSPNEKCIGGDFLKKIVFVLHCDGVLVINVIANSSEAKLYIIKSIKGYFKYIKVIVMPEITNEVFICSNKIIEDNTLKDSTAQLRSYFNLDFNPEEWDVFNY